MADFDDAIAESLLLGMDAGGDCLPDTAGLDSESVWSALRRITLAQPPRAVVLLGGASYKNKGVQPLLDAVVRCLPHPLDHPPVEATSVSSGQSVQRDRVPDAPLCAFAFKVARLPARGVVVYFRVYSGVLRAGVPLLNTTQNVRERSSKLLQILADRDREVEAIAAGHIGAMVGLKVTKTGDTLCLQGDPHPVKLPGLTLPEPVFTAALEVDTVSQEKELEHALAVLLREDPSLTVRYNDETGQTLLSGMGELHLEIAQNRLQREFGLPDVQLGRMMVSYREQAQVEAARSATFDRELNGRRHFAKLRFRIRPSSPSSEQRSEVANQVLVAEKPLQARMLPTSGTTVPEDCSELPMVELERPMEEALRDAVHAALGKGPLAGSPVVGVAVDFVEEESFVSPDTSTIAIRAAAANGIARALRGADTALLEPVMSLGVTVPERYVGSVLSDLSSTRRGRVQEVEAMEHDRSYIRAVVPLNQMVGYATAIRSMTGGEGNFSMEFYAYEPVTDSQVSERIISGEM